MPFCVWLARYTLCLLRSTCRSCLGFDLWQNSTVCQKLSTWEALQLLLSVVGLEPFKTCVGFGLLQSVSKGGILMACFRTVRRKSEHVEYPYRMLFSVWLASYTVCLERSTCRSCTGFDCWETDVIYRWLCSTCGTDVVLVGHLLPCWARCFWSAHKCIIAISYLCSATGLVMF